MFFFSYEVGKLTFFIIWVGLIYFVLTINVIRKHSEYVYWVNKNCNLKKTYNHHARINYELQIQNWKVIFCLGSLQRCKDGVQLEIYTFLLT